ncbi:MAG: HAMP domain-containing histidine kinase [Clostridium sp.]|nr:HAMP domain-containing histidine kinase [Clostridium sp.]
MKLWKKLSLATVAVLSAATVASGAAVIYRSVQYNQEKTMESGRVQLHSTAYALSRELEYGPLEGHGEATRNAYINYLLKKYGAEKYILTEGNKTLCNLTPFELVNPGDERWNRPEGYSIIQKREKKYTLIAGMKIPSAGNENYCLLLVQDISDLYEDMNGQIVFGLLIMAGAAVCAMLLVFLLTSRMLRPLKELQSAAQDISEGELKRRANVRTKDEIGAMAKAFNGMADRIENQVTELSMVSERRRQMLGSLTHELKTPMTSIIGYSDTLLHVKLKKEQQERALWHIRDECGRLERLSSKLMSLMGLYDNDSIYMEETPIKELFERVERLEEHHLKQRNIALISSCRMGSRRVDKDLFESLLVNLIDNAAKASGEGSSIWLKAEEGRITVEDKGCGIPENEIARVTEAFYMVDKARSRKAGGCGLGLALCSEIARLHGAELSIESAVGRGTKASITFAER